MADLRFGRVVGRFVSLTSGTGAIPVEVPLSGSVLLAPTVGAVALPGEPIPKTAAATAISCPIVDGWLCAPGTADPGVTVAASVQPDGQPSTVQWRAMIQLDGGSPPVSLIFEVPDGGEVDLAQIVPAQPSVGTVTVVSHADAAAAAASAAAAQQSADEAQQTAAAVESDVTELVSAALDVLPVSAADPAYGITGTADNTAAIQAAIDAAAADGRGVHFPRRPLGQPYVIGGSGIILQLPTGVPITADRGTVLRVKDGNGDYKAMLGAPTSTDLSGLSVEGLTFDQNSGGNPVASVATLFVEGTQRFVIFCGNGSDLTVRGCRFVNVDGLNTLYLGSAAMADVRVQDCDFTLVGSSPAAHDHSTIYTSCDGTTIIGNSFRGVLGGLGATTAIETHGPNQIVLGNRVESYRIGANVTGITGLGNDGILVRSNAFRNVLIGVQLWSWAGANGGLTDVSIDDNYVLINRDPWSLAASDFARGICFSQAAPVGQTLAHVEGLSITRNSIRYKASAVVLTNDYQNSGGIELVSQDSALEFRDLDLGHNRVNGSLGPALRIGAKIRRGKIHDNVWVDPSSTGEAAPPAAWRSAMVFTGNADFADVDLWRNETHDTRATHALVQGWLTSLPGGNTAVRSEEWDNTVTCSDGAVLPENSQTTGKRFAARGVPVGRRLKSGLYHTAEGGTPTTLALAAGQEYCIPFEVGSSVTFNEVTANVTAVGAAGAVLRYGLRADDGNGAPGALLADFGTATAETLGSRPVTISRVFPAGRLWLTITAQVAGCTVTAIAGWLSGASGASSVAGAIGGRSAQYQTGVTGALPATFTSGGQTPNAPAVFVRAA